MNVEILPISVGIGIFYNFLFFEWLGLSTGSLVVPGYFALALAEPMDCLITWFLGLITYSIVRLFSKIAVIYGRRQMGLNIVIGYLLAMLVNHFAKFSYIGAAGPQINVVGFIIPGLIANALLNHGIANTTSELAICSIATRLSLFILMGSEMRP